MSPDGTGYDIARRSHRLAREVRNCVASHRWSRVQRTDLRHLLQSSGAVVAQCVEARHAASRPDFTRRLALAREQAAGTMLWLEVLAETSPCRAPLPKIERLHGQAEHINARLHSILRDIS